MTTEEYAASLDGRVEALERRVAQLEAQNNPPAPDPISVGTDAFRQLMKVKHRTLQRRA